MVDLHSHALFGMDDGAQTIEDSIAILKRARKSGITKMALTPHFSIGEDVDEFVEKRDSHFKILLDEIKAEGIDIELKLGAEVYITDELFNETQLGKLTIGDSDIILAEFKYHGVSNEDFIEYIDEILNGGYRVMIAHPERYSYLNPPLVRALVKRGVLLQANAISFFEDSPEADSAYALLDERVLYCIGSDIHHARSRRLDAVERIIKTGKVDKLLFDNPEKIFDSIN